MKRAACLAAVLSVLLCPQLRAQNTTAGADRPHNGYASLGRTVLIFPFEAPFEAPFETVSSASGLEWLRESFPEMLHEQLNSPILYVASRDERLRAYDRQGIPANIQPARATLYRVAEQMDVDYVVLGSYRYNDSDKSLTAAAQLLDMRAQKLFPASIESATLADLGSLQSALAWDLLKLIRSDFSIPKDKYIASVPALRSDAMESYIRGVLAATAAEKVQNYRNATRLSPAFSRAWLELGKAHYAQHNYDLAMAALDQVPHSSPVSREANFYLGLSAYSRGDFARAESAFEFLALRLPLAEVYNNLGVVADRRGQKKAAEYFARAVHNDPSDADYHFNLGVTLLQAGDRSGAMREFRAALEHRPGDAEAKTLLDSLNSNPTSGPVVPSSANAKMPSARIKRNYDEDAFRQVNTQIGNWAEQRFSHSDARAHASFHIELGKELLAHGFAAEAEAEFHHAAAVDPSSPAPLIALAEDYDARGDSLQSRSQAEAALRLRESAEAYLLLARLDLKENKTEAAARSIDRALQLEPANAAGQDLKRTLAAQLAKRTQPLSPP